MNREAITQAAADRIFAIPGLRSTGRKVKDYAQTAAGDCPALYLGVGAQELLTEVGRPPVWRLELVAYLYCHDGSSAGPSAQMNRFLDAIDQVLGRDVPSDPVAIGTGAATTLGGLVHSARVSAVQTDEGSYGDLGVAIVTIEVISAG